MAIFLNYIKSIVSLNFKELLRFKNGDVVNQHMI